MSEEKHYENDPERTLITLEQLSQTIEVMTSVVNRLRQHLSEQLHAQMEEQQEQKKMDNRQSSDPISESEDSSEATADDEQQVATQQTDTNSLNKKKESFVVEIRQQHDDPNRKNGKTLH
jgi:hypothetical protein